MQRKAEAVSWCSNKPWADEHNITRNVNARLLCHVRESADVHLPSVASYSKVSSVHKNESILLHKYEVKLFFAAIFTVLAVLSIKFLKQIGFQPKHQIFSFHLIHRLELFKKVQERLTKSLLCWKFK